MTQHPSSSVFTRSAVTAALLGVALFGLRVPGAVAEESASASLVVEMEPGSSLSALDTTLATVHWSVRSSPSTSVAEVSGLGDVALIEPSGVLASSASVAATALRLLSGVKAVETNVEFHASIYEGEQSQAPIFIDELDLTAMRSQSAYGTTGISPPASSSGSGVRVAVLDGGFDLSQEALSGRCADGYDTLSGDSDPEDAGNGIDDDASGGVDTGVGHGTAVAAVIAVADPDAIVIPVRVLNDEGIGTTYSVATGIRYALGVGAQVANLSLGSSSASGIVETALSAAQDAGVLCVASAGNTGSTVTYPGTSPHVLTVTGTMSDGTRDPDASYGPSVDIGAPSRDIVAPYPSGGYGHWFGTSFTCALVSAAAARVLEISTDEPPLDVGQALLDASDAYPTAAWPDADGMGQGILDAASLLD